MRSEASPSKGLLFILTLVLKREGFFLFDLLHLNGWDLPLRQIGRTS